MRQCVSSASTIWVKYIFPGIFIPAIGIQAVALLIDSHRSDRPPDIQADHTALAYFWLVAWVLYAAFVLWRTGSLKRVCIDENTLLVSNYRTEWRIPFDAVESVSQPWRLVGHRVIIRLRSDFGCGATVRFAPKRRFMPFWRENPVVRELQRLAGIVA